MENYTAEKTLPKKRISFTNILIIIVLVAVLVVAGFVFGDKKMMTSIGSATLSWDFNTESDLAGYKIYYGTSSRIDSCPPGGYADKIDVGKTATPEKPSYTLSDLANGQTYYFSITSYDVSGNESCFSDEMSKTLPKSQIESIIKIFKQLLI